MPELSFRLVLVTDDAKAKLASVTQEAETAKGQIEKPVAVKITAGEALATIRDVKLAFDGVMQVVNSVVSSMNSYLDEALAARQSQKLATIAFKESAAEMSNYAQKMQSLTNVEGDQLLALMSKMAVTYKLNKTEIQELTPSLLDFAEANKATGMTVESAFDLMGKAVNGHTEMLGRYGIELDDTRLKNEGVSYIIEKLSGDYAGTAVALADLRTQNKNTWGDVKETIGDMIQVIINPLLNGLKNLMEWYQSLNPVMKGFVTGLAVAIPVVTAVATAVITLTAAVSALKIAFNPVVGIISAVVTGLSLIGFAWASTKVASDTAEKAAESYQKSVDETTISTEKLVQKHREIATSIDVAEAKRRLAEISKQIQKENDDITNFINNQVVKFSNIDYSKFYNQNKELQIEAAELTKRIAQEDYQARGKFNKEKLRIDTEASLSGLALLQYQLEYTRQHYASLGAVTNENADEQISTLEKIRALEKQIAGEKKQEAADQKSVTQDIFRADIEYFANLKELNVSSYDAMKKTMKAYYEWAKVNLPKEEADLILKQMQEANLQWGQHQAEELQKEEAHQRELAGIRDEFTNKDLELSGDTYTQQLIAIEAYYAARQDKLRQAGYTEAQITKQKNKAIMALELKAAFQMVSGVSSILGNLASAADKESKKGFAVWKGLSMAQATIDAITAANGAYKAMVGIPIVGPGLAIAASVAALAAGYVNVQRISNTKYEKAATGGMLSGKTHAEGGIIIEAEKDEYITAADRVRMLGKRFFDFVNFGPVDQVKMAFAGLPIPSVPLAGNNGMIYAAGGGVNGGANALYDLFERKFTELKNAIIDNRPAVTVIVDPISGKQVEIYEIAQAGQRLKGEF